MAVTNRARGAEKTPAWAARGKLRLAFVEGGPSVAAVWVFCGAWNNDPAVLYKNCTRYEPELIDELVSRNINAVVLTWFSGLPQESERTQREVIARLMPLLKKKKIRAIAEIQCRTAWKADPPGDMAFAQMGCVDVDLADDAWRRTILDSALQAIDAGFDGFFLIACESAFVPTFRQALGEKHPETPFLIFGNGLPSSSINYACNLKLRESGQSPGSLFNIGELKLLFEASGRDKTTLSSLRFGELPPAQAALATAEILACGAVCADNAAHVPTLAFAVEHPDAFCGDPINSVGVLVNDYDDNALADGIVGTAKLLKALARANVQHDVIPVADLSNFELRKYRVLTAAHLQRLSRETADALRLFATEHAGTIVAGTQTGRADRPDWLKSFSGLGREEAALGKGRIIHYAHAPGDLGEHDRAPNEALVSAVIADLLKYGENPLECSAPKGVVCVLWGKGTRRWVHVLNYTGAAADATISLPGCGGRKLAVHSPDQTPPEMTVIESGSARAAFQLKNLTTYAVVEVV